jgi:hypothetical protein
MTGFAEFMVLLCQALAVQVQFQAILVCKSGAGGACMSECIM